MKKTLVIFGKTVPTILVIAVLLVGIGSAAVLSYYAYLVGTATVAQSVKVDDKNWDQSPIAYTIGSSAAVAGNTYVEGPHSLTNDANVPAVVRFVTTYPEVSDPSGVTTTYWMTYTHEAQITANLADANNFNDVNAKITKTEKRDTVEFKIEILDDAPHYGVGIAIATTNQKPDFQVYFAEFGDKKWHYQVYAPGWTGTDTTILPTGITATGNEAGKVFTIEISKSLLGGIDATYNYAIQFRTTLLGTYPSGIDLWGLTYPSGISSYATQTVGKQLTGDLTIQPGERIYFWIVNSFAINLAPDTYTIQTTVVPIV